MLVGLVALRNFKANHLLLRDRLREDIGGAVALRTRAALKQLGKGGGGDLRRGRVVSARAAARGRHTLNWKTHRSGRRRRKRALLRATYRADRCDGLGEDKRGWQRATAHATGHALVPGAGGTKRNRKGGCGVSGGCCGAKTGGARAKPGRASRAN